MGGEGSSANIARGVEEEKKANQTRVLRAKQIIRTIRVVISRRMAMLIKSAILMGP
jgi:hypothetical protein